MVNERVNIRDKYGVHKKILKTFLIIFLIIVVLLVVFMMGFMSKKSASQIVLENPLKNIVLANTNEAGEVDSEKIIEQGVIEFDKEYINYILEALGTSYLHKSFLGESPYLELVLGEEIWNSEITNGRPNSNLGEIDNEDMRISLNKEEAVKAIFSSDIRQFMKDSVTNGNISIELIAGKVELFSKGYLEMYNQLTGEKINLEE